MAVLNVTGTNPIDENIRVEALSYINNLPTDTLNKLGQLAKSEKAQSKLKSNWIIIKKMVGI